MEKPKPCPFCGGEAIAIRTPHTVYIRCIKCKAMMGRHKPMVTSFLRDEYFTDEKAAIEAWNRRASDG